MNAAKSEAIERTNRLIKRLNRIWYPHTPGPWEAERASVFKAYKKERVMIAYTTFVGMGHTEQASNALLMAAAPKMFEALRVIYDLTTKYNTPLPYGCPDIKQVLELALGDEYEH